MASKMLATTVLKAGGFSHYSAAKMSKDGDISTEVLAKICATLNCEVQDIVDCLSDKIES